MSAAAVVESIGQPGPGIDRFKYERIVERSDAPKGVKDLLYALLRRTESTTCIVPAQYTPSKADLARAAGQSLSTTHRAQRAAQDLGWLYVVPGDGRGHRSTYVLTLPERVSRRSLRAVDNQAERPVKGVTVTEIKGVTVTPHSYIERHTQNHHRTDPDRGGGAAGMTTMITGELEAATGRTVTPAEASHISWKILGRARSAPVDPVAYVRHAIRNDPGEFMPRSPDRPTAAPWPPRASEVHQRCQLVHGPNECPLEES